MNDRLLKYYWHPFLIGLFPVLFFFTHNIYYIPPSDIIIPVALVIGFSVIGLGLSRLLFKSWIKAAILVSFGWSLFFYFKDFLNLARSLPFTLLHQYSVFLLLNVAVFLIAAIILYRYHKNLTALHKILNVVALVLIAFQVVRIITFYLQESNYNPATTPAETAAWKSKISPEERPDIVYLILDGYGRQDILKKYYDLDNQPFIGFLEKEGFYVAPKSTANYCRTIVSVASSLNLNYIQKVLPDNPNCQLPVAKMAEDAAIFKFLKQYDYNLYCFASGFGNTELTRHTKLVTKRPYMPHAYSNLLLKTPLSILEENAYLFDKFQQVQERFFNYAARVSKNCKTHQENILFALEKSPDYVGQNKPSFIFADVFVGHPPFIFDRHGNNTLNSNSCSIADGNHAITNDKSKRESYIQGCREQTIYLNKKIQETVAKIKANSTRPTIIVLQGDHGPGAYFDHEVLNKTKVEERFSNLNAVYFSDKKIVLPDNLTPVNTFRYILNNYFRTTLPILSNRNYYSPNSAPCRFTDVTTKLNQK